MMHDPRPGQWIHPLHCDCETCEPYRPSVPARLTAGDLARFMAAGLGTGVAIALTAALISHPDATVASLAAMIGIWL